MMFAGLVLWIGACVGHVAILAYSLNRWYGRPLPHLFLRKVRLFHGVLVLSGWLAFTWSWWLGWPVIAGSSANYLSFSALYLFLCLGVGFVVVPLSTLGRHMRPRPGFLESNHTQTVDVRAELGYRPVGRGKYRALAYLPGNEIFKVDFSERTLALPGLPPAWNGVTILHLSDLHLQGTPDRAFYQLVMDRCRDWEPDLVAITGDIVDSAKHHRWILPVLGRLRWRVAAYAVLGNHDTWWDVRLIRRRLEKIGLRVLGNGWEQITLRGEPLVVIGNEAPWMRPEPDLTTCPAEGFRLCLSHTPDNIRWGQENEIDLMLAGHNHGGQIQFPLVGSVLTPSIYGRKYDCGVFDEPPTALHVSRGLGGIQPLRYNCRPEVTKLILKVG
jgi:predicted MPP superfamily phosphohydrolase